MALLASGQALAQQPRGPQQTQRSVLAWASPKDLAQCEASLRRLRDKGVVPRKLLDQVLANPYARPFLPKVLPALEKVQHLPGTQDVLVRLAHAHDEGSARGAAFEIFAGSVLGPRLVSLSRVVDGNEWDGTLDDGTVVSMKSIASRKPAAVGRVLRHAARQLKRRTQGGRPAMLVVGHEPGVEVRRNWDALAAYLGTRLTVVTVEHLTGATRVVYRSDEPPAPKVQRPATRPARPAWLAPSGRGRRAGTARMRAIGIARAAALVRVGRAAAARHRATWTVVRLRVRALRGRPLAGAPRRRPVRMGARRGLAGMR